MIEMNEFEILPIGRAARSLPEQVAEHLLEAIIAGRIPAGTHLKELALAGVANALAARRVTDSLALVQRVRHVIRETGLLKNPLAVASGERCKRENEG